jgi:hypothetical protein
MPEVSIARVEPAWIEFYWPVIESTLGWQSARRISPSFVRTLTKAGIQQLWIAPDWRFPTRLSSVIMTTIVRKPRQPPTLRVELLSGRHLGTWIRSAARILGQYAQAHGCTRLEVHGRRGWRAARKAFAMPVDWVDDERCQPQAPPVPRPD